MYTATTCYFSGSTFSTQCTQPLQAQCRASDAFSRLSSYAHTEQYRQPIHQAAAAHYRATLQCWLHTRRSSQIALLHIAQKRRTHSNQPNPAPLHTPAGLVNLSENTCATPAHCSRRVPILACSALARHQTTPCTWSCTSSSAAIGADALCCNTPGNLRQPGLRQPPHRRTACVCCQRNQL
jgi:hypothetical protein